MPRASGSITADRLPTVQIDGVVWSQAVVGNTVYAGGSFANARPAGAAAGTNLTTRNNLLAYDITNGNLITSFAPSLNGQVLSVAASPDGTRIYVVGDFTTANGVARRRVAAYSTATGALITSFNPVGVNSQARAVIATNDTVYVGGGFAGAGSNVRTNLAAFRASDGAILPWNPNADLTVWALAISNDGASVFAGGMFSNVGGQPAYGMAKISGSTGVLDTTWKANTVVRNAGKDAAVGSLRVQGDYVYGTTWHYGEGGNLEGTFKASVATGDVQWVTDCHGDNYSTFMTGGVVYSVSHSHFCGNMGGGHPQYTTWKFNHAMAWTDSAAGDILNDVYGYHNWHGEAQAPSMVNWLPDFAMGSYTGQYQAGWSVTGNSDYVVIGGEFPKVNGVAQQGIVRFGKASVAPKTEGPKYPTNSSVPTLVATSPTSVRVTWPTAYDRDNGTLTYKVIRNGASASPVFTKDAVSQWWNLPALGYQDSGLTPGATYKYQIVVNDSDGNTVYGSTSSITMPTSVTAMTSYGSAVQAKGARIYWPMNDSAATVLRDRAAVNGVTSTGVTDATGASGVTAGQAGAIAGDTAVSLDGTDNSRIYANGTETAPDVFTAQAWVKTTTTSGGRILGFSDLQTGSSGHRDRHIYMDNAGRIVFGVRSPSDGSYQTVSGGKPYNDGAWHMISASLSPSGMVLYVDGIRVGRRTDVTAGEDYLGYWRISGDNLDGWANAPSSYNFSGLVDEVAIYPSALSQSDVLALYAASGRTSTVPAAPTDAYGAAVYADDPDLFWRLGESSGTTAVDASRSLNDGTYVNGTTQGATGVIAGNTAASFDGTDDFVASQAQFSNPTIYSEEAWFKTTSTSGGKIIGFGNENDKLSGNYDRHVYLQGDGRVVFGVWTGQTNTITSSNAYNDGEWHHVVATQAADGMKLYLDAVLVGTNPQAGSQPYTGYWRVGGDNTWGSDPYLKGTIDEAAVYSYELTQTQVINHFTAAGFALNQAPTASFTTSANQRRVSFDGSASADSDGTVTGYSWDFGDGTTGSGANPVHIYPGSGTFTAILTVTDNKGATGSTTQPVTVTAPAGPGDNYGAAVYTDHPRIYWRLADSSGNTSVDASGSGSNGTYYNGVSLGQAGALPIANKAAGFDGNDDFVSSNDLFVNPQVFTLESWFKTTTTRGGKIIGFGGNQTGSSNNYDRHVYMNDGGQLEFGVWTGQTNIITSPAAYNDGQWHYLVASMASDGMKLYVDGSLVGTNPQTSAEAGNGYWKVGGDITWNSSSSYFNGSIDEAAVYEYELSQTQVTSHYAAAQPGPNVSPVAAFTSTTADLTANLDGSTSSDPDGTVTSWAWDFGDGTSGTGETVSHAYAASGTYHVKLTVGDDRNGSNSVTRDVTVTAPNQLPVASFTSAVSKLKVDFDGSASADPDGTVASWSWDFGDSTAAGTGSKPSHTYAAAGPYTVTLTVTDDRGGQATTSQQVTAVANQAPTAAFTSSVSNKLASFDGTGSGDPDGTIASYSWDFGDGSPAGTTASPSHSYASVGTFTVTLTVTDSDGATASVSHDVVTTVPPNGAPVASFTSVVSKLKVDFDGSASADPDGTVASWSWDFGDSTAAGTGSKPSHIYAVAGTYTVVLTVTDNQGGTGSVSQQVTAVANQAPTAAFTGSMGSTAMSFDASGSADADGTISSYSWDFGDSTAAGTGKTPTHTYATSGTYTVKLTVTDSDGATATVSHDVTANRKPTAGFTNTASNLVASFDASTSTDADGTISSYSWDFGDSTAAGTGKTPNHTFAAAGTYTVKLTVTDNAGATDSVSRSVTVTAASTTVAKDTFTRSVASGWGTATTGGSWTISGTASNLAVNGSAGTMKMSAGSGPAAYLNSVSARDVDLNVQLGYDKAGTGGGIYTSLIGRRIGTSDYRLKVRVTATATTIYLAKTVSGTETVLATQNVSGLVYAPGDTWNLRFQAEGTGTTNLRAKVWKVGTSEPSSWQVTTTDTTSSLQAAGGVGIYSYLSSSGTNAPVTAILDNLSVEKLG